MVSVGEDLERRSKQIIGVVILNSPNEIENILDLDKDVTGVHIYGSIVVLKHDLESNPEKAAYSLGYKAQGSLYPVVFITAGDQDITVAKDNWDYAHKFIDTAEQKLSSLGIKKLTLQELKVANG